MGYEYLQTSVNRVLDAFLSLTDENGDGLIFAVRDYPTPLPNTMPCAVSFPPQLRSVEDVGSPYKLYSYEVPIRVYLGKPGERYTGENARDLYEWIPRLVTWVNRHPDLVFNPEQAHIEELDAMGTMITNTTRTGVFSDNPEHIGFEMTLRLRFHIGDEDEYFDED